MCAERVLNEALSGAEIKTAIVKKVEEALSNECQLSPNTAYAVFNARILFHIEMHDCGRIDTIDRTVESNLGQAPEDAEPDYLDQFDTEINIDQAPPNTVRQETEQPIPVQNSKGEMNRIRYAKKSAKPKAGTR
jgi:hypothetical protein